MEEEKRDFLDWCHYINDPVKYNDLKKVFDTFSANLKEAKENGTYPFNKERSNFDNIGFIMQEPSPYYIMVHPDGSKSKVPIGIIF